MSGGGGISGSGCTLLIESSSIHATAGYSWNNAIGGFSGGVTLSNCYIASPEGATFNEYGNIVKAGGSTSAEVVIEPLASVRSVSVSGGTMTYKLCLPGSGEEVLLVAAWYDSDGRMAGCASAETSQDGHMSGMIPVAAGQALYRLFITDGGCSPLLACWSGTE